VSDSNLPSRLLSCLGGLEFSFAFSPRPLPYSHYGKFFKISSSIHSRCRKFSNIPSNPLVNGVTHRLPCFPGNGGEQQWRQPDLQPQPTPTYSTNYTLLTSKGLLLSLETHFESLVNCASTIPTPIVCHRASTSTKRIIPATIGSEQSHDQLLPEKANTSRPKPCEISSNIRGYSKLDKSFLAAFQTKRYGLPLKGFTIPKSLVCTTQSLTPNTKTLSRVVTTTAQDRNHGSRNKALRCTWPQAKL
jgi:hypothetical protein